MSRQSHTEIWAARKDFKQKEGRFILDIRKTLFTMRLEKMLHPWRESWSGWMGLSNLIWCKMFLLIGRRGLD